MSDSKSRIVGATAWMSAVALVILVAACGGGGGSASDDPNVAQGHDLYKQTCGTCHGPNGEGMPRLGKDLRGNEFVANQSDSELVEFLKLGRSASHPDNERGVDMPPRGGNPTLTDDDLALIVVYMRSI